MRARHGKTLIALGLALQAVPALADGKFFPVTGQSSTTPDQRAVIGFDGSTQTLAIDTAFTGDGDELAWLVPLPSEPEISPGTPGMFESASAVTAMRIGHRDGGIGFVLPGLGFVFAVVGVLAMCVARQPKRVQCFVLLTPAIVLMLGVVLLPAIGQAKGVASGFSGVEVMSRVDVGVYDTAVLKGETADAVLGWLRDEGFAAPDGVEPVVDDYLRRGWCFAAARVRPVAIHTVEDPFPIEPMPETSGERRAHPLVFRFTADEPVYPMALTAVGNGPIELELFVFADGSARVDHMETVTSVRAAYPGPAPEPGYVSARDEAKHAIIVHPGLEAVSLGRSCVTRLRGTLSPEQQAEDLAIGVGPFRKHDPEYFMPGSRFERTVTVAVTVAGFFLFPAGIVMLARRGSSELCAKVLLIGILFGLAGGYASGLMVREFDGEVVRSPLTGVHSLSAAAYLMKHEASRGAISDETSGWERAREYVHGTDEGVAAGDGPLRVRFETAIDGGLWFIYHDAAGGEHRMRLLPVE